MVVLQRELESAWGFLMHLALVAELSQLLENCCINIMTSSPENVSQSLNRGVSKSSMKLAQFSLCQMTPCHGLFQLIKKHPRMSPFAYHWHNLVALDKNILKVIKSYSHGIHVLEA